MSDSVRYIHAQPQARADLNRQGLAWSDVRDSPSQSNVTEDFIRRQSQVVSNSFRSSDSAPNYIRIQEQAQEAGNRGTRDRENAMARARYATKKQRIQEDITHTQKVRVDNARNAKQHRANKRKRIENDPLHVDAGKDAKRKAESRILARANQEAQNSLDREEMDYKVRER